MVKWTIPEGFIFDLCEAYMNVYPIELPDSSIVWDVRAQLKLEPYPNPIKYGGFFQITTIKNREDLEALKAYFKEEAEYWKLHSKVAHHAINEYAMARKVTQLNLI